MSLFPLVVTPCGELKGKTLGVLHNKRHFNFQCLIQFVIVKAIRALILYLVLVIGLCVKLGGSFIVYILI